MAWHRIRHRASGEIQHVGTLEGVDLVGWEAVAIVGDRCPEPWESVTDDGSIVADTAVQALIDDEGQIGRMTSRQRHRLAIHRAQIELVGHMKALGLLTAEQAAALRDRITT